MAAGDLPIAAGFWTEHRDELTALGTVLFAFALATLVDRALARRGMRLATAVSGGQLSVATDTRLRLLRRLVFVLIVFVGVALALTQFEAVKRAAAGILASSAVLGLVVGFAARATLANLVAGVLLAISQPIRIGDLVEFEGESGIVEDIQLTYTYIRGDDGRRIIVPNERLAQSTIENFTIVDPSVEVEVQVGLPPEADHTRALELLQEVGDASVTSIDKDGVVISVRAEAEHPSERGKVAARIRAVCLERLQGETILGKAAE
jgi:small-conductance mechanosensitive channel